MNKEMIRGLQPYMHNEVECKNAEVELVAVKSTKIPCRKTKVCLGIKNTENKIILNWLNSKSLNFPSLIIFDLFSFTKTIKLLRLMNDLTAYEMMKWLL